MVIYTTNQYLYEIHTKLSTYKIELLLIYIDQVRIQRGAGGPDPPLKITIYKSFYRE